MKFTPARPTIYGETLESLTALLTEHGHPAFRARQILTWLYKKRVRTWEEMTDLSRPLRAWLAATLVLSRKAIFSLGNLTKLVTTDCIGFDFGSGGRITALPAFSLAQWPLCGRGIDKLRQIFASPTSESPYRRATTVTGSVQISL